MVKGLSGSSGIHVGVPDWAIGLCERDISGDKPKAEQVGSIPMQVFLFSQGFAERP